MATATIKIDTAKVKARVYARIEQELADTIEEQSSRKLGHHQARIYGTRDCCGVRAV